MNRRGFSVALSDYMVCTFTKEGGVKLKEFHILPGPPEPREIELTSRELQNLYLEQAKVIMKNLKAIQ